MKSRSSWRLHELLAAKRQAEAKFRSYPNVLAIGVGPKFQRRKRSGQACVQFFVTRKLRSIRSQHRIPRFLYAKSRAGRRLRIPTDVIAVGSFQAAATCCAGSGLYSNCDHGLITLIFQNKVRRSRTTFLVSCAHVVGDMRRSLPAFPQLSSASSTVQPLARTVAASTAQAGEIQYDIAIAKIRAAALPLRELRIHGKPQALRSFLPPASIQPGLGVDAVLSRGATHGTVDSVHASADIQYPAGTFRVHNLFGLNIPAARGDSGGLVFQDTRAVGIVVAASPEGWLWFQPLQPAVEFLSEISGIQFSVFNTPKENP